MLLDEQSLSAHLDAMLDEDGTVYGVDDEEEPRDPDQKLAAFKLFSTHIEEELIAGDGPWHWRWQLVPGDGIQIRD